MCDRRSLDDYLVNALSKTKPFGKKAQPMEENNSLADRICAVEKEMLAQAAMKCRTTREAARFLGISQPSVVRKFKNHGLTITKK